MVPCRTSHVPYQKATPIEPNMMNRWRPAKKATQKALRTPVLLPESVKGME
jgi:hypothetical protein